MLHRIGAVLEGRAAATHTYLAAVSVAYLFQRGAEENELTTFQLLILVQMLQVRVSGADAREGCRCA